MTGNGVVLATASLPSFVAIRTNEYYDTSKGHMYYKESESVLALGEESVFSTLVKIELEPAKSSDKYVSLRFCYTNLYWSRAVDDKIVLAESSQPEKDTTNPLCTLFTMTQLLDSDVYLTHVHSGGRVVFDGAEVYVDDYLDRTKNQGYLKLVDYSTVVKLPATSAVKGSNGKYLQTDGNFLYFISDDPNVDSCIFEFVLLADGYVRIRVPGGWVWTAYDDVLNAITLSPDSGAGDVLTHFWPVKINESTIALRTKDSNRFCDCASVDGYTFLRQFPTTITTEARLGLEALVLGSRLYNVRYGLDYARIFNETPFVAGSSTLRNEGDEVASMDVEIGYEDSKSSTFNRSASLTMGMKTSFSTGIPLIVEGKIEVSAEVSGTLEWGTTTTETKTVTAKGSVPIPGKSMAKVDYVGTKSTCNLPFSYTQEDQRSTDDGFDRFDNEDGIFTGVNYYNFNFVVRSVKALK